MFSGSSAVRSKTSGLQTQLPKNATIKGPAFVGQEHLAVTDEWLVEDVRPSKRKRQDINGVFSTSGTKRTRTERNSLEKSKKQNHRRSPSPVSDHERIDNIDILFGDSEDNTSSLSDNSSLNDVPVIVESNEEMPRLSSRTARPRQTTMTQFTSSQTDPRQPEGDSDKPAAVPAESPQTVDKPQAESTGPVKRVKVKIEGTLIMVPLLPRYYEVLL